MGRDFVVGYPESLLPAGTRYHGILGISTVNIYINGMKITSSDSLSVWQYVHTKVVWQEKSQNICWHPLDMPVKTPRPEGDSQTTYIPTDFVHINFCPWLDSNPYGRGM